MYLAQQYSFNVVILIICCSNTDNQKMPNDKDIYTLPNYDTESSFYAEAGMPAPKVYDQPNMGQYVCII